MRVKGLASVLLAVLLLTNACGGSAPNPEGTSVARDKATMEALATSIIVSQVTPAEVEYAPTEPPELAPTALPEVVQESESDTAPAPSSVPTPRGQKILVWSPRGASTLTSVAFANGLSMVQDQGSEAALEQLRQPEIVAALVSSYGLSAQAYTELAQFVERGGASCCYMVQVMLSTTSFFRSCLACRLPRNWWQDPATHSYTRKARTRPGAVGSR